MDVLTLSFENSFNGKPKATAYLEHGTQSPSACR